MLRLGCLVKGMALQYAREMVLGDEISLPHCRVANPLQEWERKTYSILSMSITVVSEQLPHKVTSNSKVPSGKRSPDLTYTLGNAA